MSWAYLIPVIGAIGVGGGTLLEKLVLRKRKITPRSYQAVAFLAIIIVMIPFLFFFWKMEAQAFSLTSILVFFGIVVSSVLANVFVFYALKWEKICNIEPARLLEPLFVILLAVIFSFIFGQTLFERNTQVLIPALVAAVALIASHIKKHHLEFNKYFIAAIIGSFFFAFELVLSKFILNYYSPISLYFLRCLFVFIISFLIFKPKLKDIDKKARWEIVAASAIWVVYRVMTYYGFQTLGVIFTTLILMLGPIFIYLFAWKFLKEKPGWRNIAAAIVIIASVLYAIFI